MDLPERRNSIAEQGALAVSGSRFTGPARKGGSTELLALIRKDIDALYLKGPRGLQLVHQLGLHVVADLGSHPDPLIRANNCTPRPLTVDQRLLDERPDLVVALVRTVIETGEWAAQHADDTVRFIGLETSTADSWVRHGYGASVHESMRLDLSEQSIAALTSVKDFLFENGFLQADFSVAEWLAPEPFKAARPGDMSTTIEKIGFAVARQSADEFVPLSDFAEKARYDINEAGRFLHEHGALSPNRSFNAGVRLPGEDKFVLGGFTPRGEEMAPAAVIGFDGTYYQGKVKKNHLELLEVYASVFRERPHVNAGHSHSLRRDRSVRDCAPATADRVRRIPAGRDARADPAHSVRAPTLDGGDRQLGAQARNGAGDHHRQSRTFLLGRGYSHRGPPDHQARGNGCGRHARPHPRGCPTHRRHRRGALMRFSLFHKAGAAVLFATLQVFLDTELLRRRCPRK